MVVASILATTHSVTVTFLHLHHSSLPFWCALGCHPNLEVSALNQAQASLRPSMRNCRASEEILYPDQLSSTLTKWALAARRRGLHFAQVVGVISFLILGGPVLFSQVLPPPLQVASSTLSSRSSLFFRCRSLGSRFDPRARAHAYWHADTRRPVPRERLSLAPRERGSPICSAYSQCSTPTE